MGYVAQAVSLGYKLSVAGVAPPTVDLLKTEDMRFEAPAKLYDLFPCATAHGASDVLRDDSNEG